MASFDVKLEPDMVKVGNGISNTDKEIGTRFDFKGTSAAIESKDKEITITGDSDFQIEQVLDVLRNKMTKAGVDIRFMDTSAKVEKIGGDRVKQVVKVKAGIEGDLGKKLQQLIKGSKIKVTAAIQGDIVRVQGSKLDDLQAVQALIRKDITDVPLTFDNYRS